MKKVLYILAVVAVVVFASCKKENEANTAWYYYTELDCNLNPFAVTNDSLQNFKNCADFLQSNSITVIRGFPLNHGPGRAILACGGPRHFGYTHYVLLYKRDIEKAVSLQLKPMTEKDI